MPKASKKRTRPTDAPGWVRWHQNSIFGGFNVFDGIVEEAKASLWRRWLEFAVILIAFLSGGVAILTFVPGASATVPQNWKILLVSAAALSLGFGAAAVFYGRLRERQADQLRAGFESLRVRADALVAKFDEYERKKRQP